ncbi:MAG: hypothetical protein HN348_36350 [Proteobacteria bacterium]|nr:hypothetical protein [Pseudomonadota bacterium]
MYRPISYDEQLARFNKLLEQRLLKINWSRSNRKFEVVGFVTRSKTGEPSNKVTSYTRVRELVQQVIGDRWMDLVEDE